MAAEFFPAKNGSLTCSENGSLLHSAYNPESEAQHFTESLQVPFLPCDVFITEPAVSYCAAFLRKRFPDSKIHAIRYSHSFDKYNNLWDSVLYSLNEESSSDFENELFSIFGEERICSSLFYAWQPSSRTYKIYDSLAWNAIKNTIEKSRCVLFTRSFFAERWLKNTAKFICFTQKTCSIKKGDSPVIITASGPSLKGIIPFLKKNRQSYFLTAASSSLAILLFNNIIPDICITTDGGFWASTHLAKLCFHADIPVALPPSASCPLKVLETNKIIPLFYKDSIEREFVSSCGFTGIEAEPNGTVSGTAVRFALSITSGPVYICGLDLAPSNGFQHTQPNEIEISYSASDSRISPNEKRHAGAAFQDTQLAIYRNWFSSAAESFSGRVSRLSNNFVYKNKLGSISDISPEKIQFKKNTINPLVFKSDKITSDEEVKNKASDFISQNAFSDNWLKYVFPAEYISWKRSIEKSEKKTRWETLENRNRFLVEKIKRIIHG